MNEKLILDMAKPYLKEGTLTYNEFEKIYSMLSIREQYAVIEVLYKNNIELVEDKELSEHMLAEEVFDENEQGFKILYDDSLFEDEDRIKDKDEHAEPLKVRKKILLSNRALIQMIQNGDAQARQDLCVKNQGLVDKWSGIYEKMLGNKLEFDDLRQAGMLGMIKAAQKFDLNIGTEFSTYAVWWIKQSIIREIEDNGYTIRIPVHKIEQIYKVVRSDNNYAYENDYFKRIKLISDDTGIPIVIIEESLRIFHQFIRATSLDTPVGEDEDTLLLDIIPNENEITTEDIVTHKFLREQLMEILETLTEREQKILKLRFGFDDGQERTLEEIGQIYNVSRERIRQIEEKALKKIKKSPYNKKLKDYLN